MASVTLSHIKKVYEGDITAVSDFCLEIEDREFVILVGPSGCGKSTTLRMIAGLEDITDGQLSIGDDVVNDLPPKDRDIAMVFQNYALYPHMSVYDNMAFGLKMRGVPKEEIRQRVEEVAAQLEITEFLKRKPAALSGGQRQRVALGRAMVREPAVFLLDEPLSNLDAKLRASMRTEILQLHRRMGTTFVYVTHDQTEAMTMADRIVVMKDGFIQQVDTPEEIYRHPRNLFVAEFIGSPRINLFDAVPRQLQDHMVLEFLDTSLPLPPSATEALSAHLDRTVRLGVRPEEIELVRPGTPDAIPSAVELTELLGAESLVHLTACGQPLTVRCAPSHFESGQPVHFTVKPGALHLFDAETEETLLCRP